MKPICIYHGNCADGFTAAWAVWRRFGDAWEYYPGIYQDPPPNVTGRDVVLVDFSYKRDVLLDMAKTARSILILDHHKSAAEDLESNRPSIDRLDDPIWVGDMTWERHMFNVEIDHNEGASKANIYAYFDMDRSGAGIAWDFFNPDCPRPKLVNYVEDRDLWRFALPFSREISANIFSFEYTFENWNDMAEEITFGYNEFVAGGVAIERKHHKDIKELLPTVTQMMVIGGYRVPVANLPYVYSSDAGNLMAQTATFGACYWDTPKGRVFSLRSVGDFDVSAVAKQYGGGGHLHAAGFTLKPGQNL